MEGTDTTVARPEDWTDEQWTQYISVTKVAGDPAGEASTVEVAEMAADGEGADRIINPGDTSWKVIDEGRVSSVTSMARAVPDVDDWANVTGGAKATVKWSLTYKNLLDTAVVDVDIQLKWDYGATYNGGGAFIPALWVKVPTFDVAWGFGVAMDVSIGSPTNSGSATAPVASLPVTVTARVAGPQTDETTEWSFTLSGDGSWHAA